MKQFIIFLVAVLSVCSMNAKTISEGDCAVLEKSSILSSREPVGMDFCAYIDDDILLIDVDCIYPADGDITIAFTFTYDVQAITGFPSRYYEQLEVTIPSGTYHIEKKIDFGLFPGEYVSYAKIDNFVVTSSSTMYEYYVAFSGVSY